MVIKIAKRVIMSVIGRAGACSAATARTCAKA